MLDAKTISKGIVRATLILFGIAAGAYALFLIKPLFIYVGFAFVLALIGKPLANFLTKKLKIKRIFSIIITMVFFLCVCLGFVFMFVPLFTTQAKNLSVLNTYDLQLGFNGLIEKLNVYLSSNGFSLEQIIQKSHLRDKLNLDFIPNLLNTFLGMISEIGMGIFSILFITFFFIKDQVLLEYQFKKIFPSKHENKVFKSIDKINALLSRYFLGLVIQMTIIFLLVLTNLAIFGVNGAVMIAFLCAVLNIIPYLGPLIGSILGVLLTMLSYIGEDFLEVTIPKTISVAIGFLLIQLLDNSVNQPLIFSNSVKSHPLEIFIVILVAGMIGGIFGMIIAVPLYTCFKVIGKEFLPNNRFIQVLTKKL